MSATMSFMPPLSLRTRLTLVYLAGVIVTLAAVSVVLRQTLRGRLVAALDQELARGAAAAQIVVADTGTSNPAELSRRLNNLSPSELAAAPFLVTVRGPDGRPVASVPAGLENLLEPQSVGTRTVQTDGSLRLRVLTEPLPGGGIVEAAETMDSVEGPLEQHRTATLLAAAAALPLVAAFAYVLAGRGLQPLEDVVAFAAQVRAGDLRRRLTHRRRPPEVQRLADAFDEMLERLEAAFAQQRRFVGDVSHELRTPLTALRGGIDVLLMQPDLSPEEQEQLDELSQECSRLIRLTRNLLGLAQAEAGRTPNVEPVEMDRICLEAVRQARALREDVAVEVAGFVPITVMGDGDLLLQMVLNLLENAVRFSPEGGAVVLSLERQGDAAVVQVTDSGPGIGIEHLPHIFERFYRVADGRNARGGTGLGLAIVRWIATAHGGDVTAENQAEKGARFTITIPLAHTAGPDRPRPVLPDTARPRSV
jgi:heavy metal sensor kinase